MPLGSPIICQLAHVEDPSLTKSKRGLVTMRHPARPLRSVTKCHSHESDHVGKLHSEKSDKWLYMKGSMLFLYRKHQNIGGQKIWRFCLKTVMLKYWQI